MKSMYTKQFEELSSSFFRDGLLKSVYSDENVNVCNLANTTYVLFSYDMMCKGKENFVGILFNGKYLQQVIENPVIILNNFINSNDKDRLEVMVPLNNSSYQIMKQMKVNTDIHGPSKEINLQLEQELMAKNKSR